MIVTSCTTELLPFESEVFGRPSARLVVEGVADAVAFESDVRAEAGKWKRDGLFLVSCRLGEAQAEKLEPALQAAGFSRIETLVTFERALEGGFNEPAFSVERASMDDLEGCVGIARAAFKYDRFHADGRFPPHLAAKLKEAWVSNDLKFRGHLNLVAKADQAVCGFIFCMRRADVSIVDLIAVSTERQHRGIGRSLTLAAMSSEKQSCRTMRVGTQEANTASCGLYASLGFNVVSRARTYHWMQA